MKKVGTLLLTLAMMIVAFKLTVLSAYASSDTHFAYRVDVIDTKAISASRIAIDVAANVNGKVYAYATGTGSETPTVDDIKKKGTVTEITANKESTATAYCYYDRSYVRAGNSYDVFICFEAGNGKTYGPYVEKGWVAKYFATGDGTKANPYQIWNYRHLFNIIQAGENAYVKLMQNIDLADCPYSGYVIDGTFDGEFDGNHKSIINMYGILTKKLAEGSVIKDTYLVGVNSVTEGKKSIQYYDSTFVDKNYGTIMDCAVINSDYNTHNDTYNVGVICETNLNTGVISGCKVANCSIICAQGYVGGIVGRNEGTVSECYFEGTITNTSDTSGSYGGIVGFNYGSKATVDKCYSNVIFDSRKVKGGIVGHLSGGLVSNCVSNYIPDDVWSVVRSLSSNQGSIVGNTASGVSNSNVSQNQGAIVSKPAWNGTEEGKKELEKLESVWEIYNGTLSQTGSNTMVDPLSDAVIATCVANITGMSNIGFSLELYPSYETLEYNTLFSAKKAVETVSHDYTRYVSLGNGKHKIVCSICGDVKPGHEADACLGGTATCKAKAKCSKCKTEYGNLASHTYDVVWKTDGTSHWHACSVCGAKKDIAAHTLKTTTTLKATTATNGKKETKCSICSKVTKNTIIYAAKTIKLSATKYTYDGKVKTPSVIVKDSNGNVISNTNFTVTYPTGRKNVGKYIVKVTFKGDYSGSKKLAFIINPPKTSISSIVGKSKSFAVKWAKKTTQVTGYEIQYSTSKTFASGNKTVKITSAKTVSKTIKELKAKRTYYVRVRTYKTVGATKFYSDWSAKKSVTTKK